MRSKLMATVFCSLTLTGYLAGCAAQASKTTGGTQENQTQVETSSDLAKDSILLFDGNEAARKLVSDMEAGRIPKSCTALYDQMGALPSVTVTKEDDVRQMYDLVSRIRVLGKSDMSVTDSYHFVSFTLQDGTKVGYRFEGAGNLVGDATNYQVKGDSDLWAHVQALQGAQQTQENAHAITVVEGEDMMLDCPTSAVEGEVVRFHTLSVADAKVVVSVTDAEVTSLGMNGYEFVMPDRPVEISVFIKDLEVGGA